jgi:hypothetical protein
MRDRERALAMATLIAAMAAAATAGLMGCAGNVPPAPDWLPARQQTAASPFGAFAALRVRDSRHDEREVMGELIAVEQDSTYVLTEDPSLELVALGNESIVRIGIRTHRPSGGTIIATEAHLTRGVGRAALERVRPWARFPQGLPAHLDRWSLRLPQLQQKSD